MDPVPSQRFRRLRTLGEGSMGVVYEARDEQLGTTVALKAIRAPTPETVGHLRQEFRALQDVRHPNLVAIGELVTDTDECFFTMELVEGDDFIAYLRSGDHASGEPRLYDEGKLRNALVQLAQGLCALHAAGLVHRDVKPANVLVTRDGRVVLLDFGLAAKAPLDPSADDGVVGTPAYMAPEQAASGRPGPEADWYAVGIMLYEALTGRVPFTGAPLDVLLRKQREQPPPPSAVASDVPSDLDALCVALLRFDPALRPGGPALLRDLRARRASFTSASQTQSAPFVGRARELETLDAALRSARTRAALVLVRGEPGIGKSCLVRRFVETIGITEPGLIVLAGRCLGRGTVAYNAVEGVIESLARLLAQAPPSDVDAWLPARIEPLVQLFPVLRRTRAVAERTSDSRLDPPRLDQVELRGRAFGVLRELLGRVASARPLVISIEDLHLADRDSLALLTDVMRTPGAPQLLLLGTGAASVGAGDRVREELAHAGTELREIDLARLSAERARELASLLLERAAPQSKLSASAVAEAAEGLPLLVDALVRDAMRAPGNSRARDSSADRAPATDAASERLGRLLWSRVAELEPPARDIVELLAAAGAPVSQDVLARAAELERGAFVREVAFLRVAHLVTRTGARGGDAIDVYHHEVRAAVVSRLDDAAKRRAHERLAVAFETSEARDPEALFIHWRAAEDRVRAASYAEAAAARAVEALAFEHAAALYEQALELGQRAAPARATLSEKLGDAYANAGHGDLAARAYRSAATGATSARALDLRSRAAAQLLISGHFDEGLDATDEVLGDVGLRLARSPLEALVMVLLWRLVITLRGIDFRPRDVTQIAARELARVDVCASVAWHLPLADATQAMAFQERRLVLALRCGEPTRVLLALSAEAAYSASLGTRHWRGRTAKLIERTRELAASVGDPRASATRLGLVGMAHYLGRGGFLSALESCREATLALRECTDVSWLLSVARLYALYSLAYLGRWDELAVSAEELLRDARARGDLFTVVNCTTGVSVCAWLARDEPALARAHTADALRKWSKRSFQITHYYEALGLALVDLYEGLGDAAHQRLEAMWPKMRRSFYLRVQVLRIEGNDARARAMLAAAGRARGRERARLVGRARRIARDLHHEGAAWAGAMACLLDAGAAHTAGDRSATARLLEEAARACETADMALHATVARWCRASLDGAAPVPDAPVRNFARVVALLAPPFALDGSTATLDR